MRFGVLASKNIFVEETTIGISDYFHINAIILKTNEDRCDINSNDKINLTYINKKSLLSLLKLPFTIKRTEKLVDGFVVHYMNPYFALLIASGIIDKPIAYFCYGSDVRNSKIINWLVKKALERVDLIFVGTSYQKEYLHNFFGIPYDRLESSKIVFPVNPSFKKKIDLSENQKIRIKWKLFKRYVIFSPRTVKEHYNHHLLVKGINHLDDSIKKEVQIVITGYGNQEYIWRLVEFGMKNNIDIVNLDKFLTPQEMAEIYNISLINVNIPKHDQSGRSIMEGCICGSIPLLNVKIPAYHEFFKDNENCVFVKPEPKAIATKVEWILKNKTRFTEPFYVKNANIFMKYQNTKQIYHDLTETIEEIVTSKKEDKNELENPIIQNIL